MNLISERVNTMNMSTENIRNTLEEKASAYISRPFTLIDFAEDASDQKKYLVHGTIQRYNATVNVEVTFKKDGLEPRYWYITDETITMPSSRIGTITLGETVCVTDPCYERETWCATELRNVRPGLWDVFTCVDEIDCWGKRTYVIELFHRDVQQMDLEKLEWIERASLGVDSGQMSIFDDKYYRTKDGSAEIFEADEACKNTFYESCCSLSLNYAGIYRTGGKAVGVVCASGCGDGSYPLSIKEIDFKVVAIKINFM